MEHRIYGESWIRINNKETELIGCKCEDCKSYWFPKRTICPNCFGEQLAETTISNTGEVYSLTTLHAGSKGFETPITIGYIDFPEGVRICGQIEGPIDIGSKVTPSYGKIRTDADGIPVFSYKFKPVN